MPSSCHQVMLYSYLRASQSKIRLIVVVVVVGGGGVGVVGVFLRIEGRMKRF